MGVGTGQHRCELPAVCQSIGSPQAPLFSLPHPGVRAAPNRLPALLRCSSVLAPLAKLGLPPVLLSQAQLLPQQQAGFQTPLDSH